MLTKLEIFQEHGRVPRQVFKQVRGQLKSPARWVIRQQVCDQVLHPVRDSILFPLYWEARRQLQISRPS